MLYRILVVDDEELITDSLAGMLAEAPQYELDVYKAYSGSEALELLNEQQFDIVVSDICMPGISGIGLAQKIREKWPLCHVIFQTGYDDFQYAQRALRYGADDYILKPIKEEELLDALIRIRDLHFPKQQGGILFMKMRESARARIPGALTAHIRMCC